MTTPPPRIDPPFPLPRVTSARVPQRIQIAIGVLVATLVLFVLLEFVDTYLTAKSWKGVIGIAVVWGLFRFAITIVDQFRGATVMTSEGLRVGWRAREVRFVEIRSFRPHRFRRRAVAVLYTGDRILLFFEGLNRETAAHAFRWIETHIGANVFK